MKNRNRLSPEPNPWGAIVDADLKQIVAGLDDQQRRLMAESLIDWATQLLRSTIHPEKN